MEYLKADAYRTELTDSLKATDDEVKQYYEEHKDTYDQVDYREFTIKAVDTTDVRCRQPRQRQMSLRQEL